MACHELGLANFVLAAGEYNNTVLADVSPDIVVL